MVPGFDARLRIAPRYVIKPEDTYVCAIEFTYYLASSGWETVVPSGHEAYSMEVNGLRVAFGSLAQSGDQYQLQNKHLVLGLLEAVNTLASRQSFCNTRAALYMYNKPVGQLAIGRLINPISTRLKHASVVRNVINANTPSQNLTVERRIVDPDDPDFVISYEMLEDPIPCQALLNAALNALANTAPVRSDHIFTDFGSTSSAGDVTCMISRNPPGTTRLLLTYNHVRTALALLPAKLYSDDICGEVKFDLIYGGEELGGGTFFLS